LVAFEHVTVLYLFEIKNDHGETEYVISLLNPSSCGNIPEEAIVGTADQPSMSKITSITANPPFIRFMHSIVQFHAPRVPAMLTEAEKQRNGIIFVIDRRVADIYGAIEPEDIIGAFEVHERFIHPETYRPNPKHRLFTQKSFFQLDSLLENELRAQLASK